MKLLIDNNLSPFLADALKAAGHDAVHLRDLGMQAATDDVVLEHARADEWGASCGYARLKSMSRPGKRMSCGQPACPH